MQSNLKVMPPVPTLCFQPAHQPPASWVAHASRLQRGNEELTDSRTHFPTGSWPPQRLTCSPISHLGLVLCCWHLIPDTARPVQPWLFPLIICTNTCAPICCEAVNDQPSLSLTVSGTLLQPTWPMNSPGCLNSQMRTFDKSTLRLWYM